MLITTLHHRENETEHPLKARVTLGKGVGLRKKISVPVPPQVMEQPICTPPTLNFGDLRALFRQLLEEWHLPIPKQAALPSPPLHYLSLFSNLPHLLHLYPTTTHKVIIKMEKLEARVIV